VTSLTALVIALSNSPADPRPGTSPEAGATPGDFSATGLPAITDSLGGGES
jgi:hypothetical protein